MPLYWNFSCKSSSTLTVKVKGKGIDPENVLFNFSSYVLSDNGKSLLSKSLNFSVPNKNVEISEYLCPFELLYPEVSDFSKDSSDKELLKCKLKELSLSSHRRLKHNILEENLSMKELESLKESYQEFWYRNSKVW